MASSTSATAAPTSFSDALSHGGTAGQSVGISLDSFLASMISGVAAFGVELSLFLVLHGKFGRI